MPFEELPYEFNPERGYVSSANNKTAPDDYPHYISHWFAQTHRINRIREMIEAKPKLGIGDFEEMHGDFKSSLVSKILPVFLQSFKKENNWGEKEGQFIAMLENWMGFWHVKALKPQYLKTFTGNLGKTW